MAKRRALITGITGQDGSYLADLLYRKGYDVHGLIRRTSTFNTERIQHLFVDPHKPDVPLKLYYGDMTDGGSLRRVIARVRPHEIYNLAAQSHVGVSFQQPELTSNVNALGTLRLLEAIRELEDRGIKPPRLYQAGTSEMFGSTPPPQSEESRFHPRSPYAAAKVFAHQMCVHYREAYGYFICNGILFNHESERRLETFVTRKITRTATRIKLGLETRLYLGNLDARRDWGHARDFVDAMWRMLQQDAPGDYVVATGQSRSVRDFLAAVFGRLGLDWQEYTEIDERYLRPTEVEHLEGDATRARTQLGWEPHVSFDQLVEGMVEHDLALARRELFLKEGGHETNIARDF